MRFLPWLFGLPGRGVGRVPNRSPIAYLQVVERILLNLPAVDRVNCALVCHRWAEAVSSSRLLNDVWFNTYGLQLGPLVETQRQYPNLRMFKCT